MSIISNTNPVPKNPNVHSLPTFRLQIFPADTRHSRQVRDDSRHHPSVREAETKRLCFSDLVNKLRVRHREKYSSFTEGSKHLNHATQPFILVLNVPCFRNILTKFRCLMIRLIVKELEQTGIKTEGGKGALGNKTIQKLQQTHTEYGC